MYFSVTFQLLDSLAETSPIEEKQENGAIFYSKLVK